VLIRSFPRIMTAAFLKIAQLVGHVAPAAWTGYVIRRWVLNRGFIVFDSREFSIQPDAFNSFRRRALEKIHAWYVMYVNYMSYRKSQYIGYCTKLSVLKDLHDSVTNTGCLWFGNDHKCNEIELLSVSPRGFQ